MRANNDNYDEVKDGNGAGNEESSAGYSDDFVDESPARSKGSEQAFVNEDASPPHSAGSNATSASAPPWQLEQDGGNINGEGEAGKQLIAADVEEEAEADRHSSRPESVGSSIAPVENAASQHSSNAEVIDEPSTAVAANDVNAPYFPDPNPPVDAAGELIEEPTNRFVTAGYNAVGAQSSSRPGSARSNLGPDPGDFHSLQDNMLTTEEPIPRPGSIGSNLISAVEAAPSLENSYFVAANEAASRPGSKGSNAPSAGYASPSKKETDFVRANGLESRPVSGNSNAGSVMKQSSRPQSAAAEEMPVSQANNITDQAPHPIESTSRQESFERNIKPPLLSVSRSNSMGHSPSLPPQPGPRPFSKGSNSGSPLKPSSRPSSSNRRASLHSLFTNGSSNGAPAGNALTNSNGIVDDDDDDQAYQAALEHLLGDVEEVTPTGESEGVIMKQHNGFDLASPPKTFVFDSRSSAHNRTASPSVPPMFQKASDMSTSEVSGEVEAPKHPQPGNFRSHPSYKALVRQPVPPAEYKRHSMYNDDERQVSMNGLSEQPPPQQAPLWLQQQRQLLQQQHYANLPPQDPPRRGPLEQSKYPSQHELGRAHSYQNMNGLSHADEHKRPALYREPIIEGPLSDMGRMPSLRDMGARSEGRKRPLYREEGSRLPLYTDGIRHPSYHYMARVGGIKDGFGGIHVSPRVAKMFTSPTRLPAPPGVDPRRLPVNRSRSVTNAVAQAWGQEQDVRRSQSVDRGPAAIYREPSIKLPWQMLEMMDDERQQQGMSAKQRKELEEKRRRERADRMALEAAAGRKREEQMRLEARRAAIRDRIQKQHVLQLKLLEERARAAAQIKQWHQHYKAGKPLHERFEQDFKMEQERIAQEKQKQWDQMRHKGVRPHQLISGEVIFEAPPRISPPKQRDDPLQKSPKKESPPRIKAPRITDDDSGAFSTPTKSHPGELPPPPPPPPVEEEPEAPAPTAAPAPVLYAFSSISSDNHRMLEGMPVRPSFVRRRKSTMVDRACSPMIPMSQLFYPPPYAPFPVPGAAPGTFIAQHPLTHQPIAITPPSAFPYFMEGNAMQFAANPIPHHWPSAHGHVFQAPDPDKAHTPEVHDPFVLLHSPLQMPTAQSPLPPQQSPHLNSPIPIHPSMSYNSQQSSGRDRSMTLPSIVEETHEEAHSSPVRKPHNVYSLPGKPDPYTQTERPSESDPHKPYTPDPISPSFTRNSAEAMPEHSIHHKDHGEGHAREGNIGKETPTRPTELAEAHGFFDDDGPRMESPKAAGSEAEQEEVAEEVEAGEEAEDSVAGEVEADELESEQRVEAPNELEAEARTSASGLPDYSGEQPEARAPEALTAAEGAEMAQAQEEGEHGAEASPGVAQEEGGQGAEDGEADEGVIEKEREDDYGDDNVEFGDEDDEKLELAGLEDEADRHTGANVSGGKVSESGRGYGGNELTGREGEGEEVEVGTNGDEHVSGSKVIETGGGYGYSRDGREDEGEMESGKGHGEMVTGGEVGESGRGYDNNSGGKEEEEKLGGDYDEKLTQSRVSESGRAYGEERSGNVDENEDGVGRGYGENEPGKKVSVSGRGENDLGNTEDEAGVPEGDRGEHHNFVGGEGGESQRDYGDDEVAGREGKVSKSPKDGGENELTEREDDLGERESTFLAGHAHDRAEGQARNSAVEKGGYLAGDDDERGQGQAGTLAVEEGGNDEWIARGDEVDDPTALRSKEAMPLGREGYGEDGGDQTALEEGERGGGPGGEEDDEMPTELGGVADQGFFDDNGEAGIAAGAGEEDLDWGRENEAMEREEPEQSGFFASPSNREPAGPSPDDDDVWAEGAEAVVPNEAADAPAASGDQEENSDRGMLGSSLDKGQEEPSNEYRDAPVQDELGASLGMDEPRVSGNNGLMIDPPGAHQEGLPPAFGQEEARGNEDYAETGQEDGVQEAAAEDELPQAFAGDEYLEDVPEDEEETKIREMPVEGPSAGNYGESLEGARLENPEGYENQGAVQDNSILSPAGDDDLPTGLAYGAEEETLRNDGEVTAPIERSFNGDFPADLQEGPAEDLGRQDNPGYTPEAGETEGEAVDLGAMNEPTRDRGNADFFPENDPEEGLPNAPAEQEEYAEGGDYLEGNPLDDERNPLDDAGIWGEPLGVREVY